MTFKANYFMLNFHDGRTYLQTDTGNYRIGFAVSKYDFYTVYLRYLDMVLQTFKETQRSCNISTRSLDPIYIVTYYTKWGDLGQTV